MYCKNCRATIKDAADSCPQCLSPALFVNIKFLFQLFVAALSNPASILFALLTVASLELIVTRSNVSSLPLALFPLNDFG